MVAGRVPIIVGPTAVGKTAVALALAEHWPLEVVSADSRQIYRRLDIGTAKPTPRERRRVPHHGLDLVDPGQRYSAGKFAQDASRWIDEIRARGRLPVLVGGTGLYIRALIDGLFLEPPMDPERRKTLERWIGGLGTTDLVRWASRLDPGFRGGGRQRATRAIEVGLLSGRPLSYWQQHARAIGTVEPWYVVLTVPRPVLHRRIEVRAGEMVRRGLIEEVAAALADGAAPGAPGMDGVGVREAVEYLGGLRPRDSVAGAVATATRQYAKRQETWFRHQLRAPVLAVDATRPPDELAADIAAAWARVTERSTVP
ncbi:MAG: tRNA (adenosine(37)-N6)-dimethylallyltransferase MiaA [Gemmatimonadales bacterium]|nr:tRNA (adenosine(37)-N6)-dimethylallyltransferase MiaA [Gemmatimonadales bacterium]